MSDNYLTIVPAKDSEGNPALGTQGTEVRMPDGTPVPGITGVKIEGSACDVWRVTLEVYALPSEIKAKLVSLMDRGEGVEVRLLD